ncbi:hypothetical protein AaE_001556 [Aphanomyces astaci]|uniref:Uncharacterized protein n=1 Tax=Aphanomyces astaci TaxID=112090 RepID=A0A6A5AHT1_APHAT|nr:hypothetical protein AaE_001556 [Aphanomyces astaci]
MKVQHSSISHFAMTAQGDDSSGGSANHHHEDPESRHEEHHEWKSQEKWVKHQEKEAEKEEKEAKQHAKEAEKEEKKAQKHAETARKHAEAARRHAEAARLIRNATVNGTIPFHEGNWTHPSGNWSQHLLPEATNSTLNQNIKFESHHGGSLSLEAISHDQRHSSLTTASGLAVVGVLGFVAFKVVNKLRRRADYHMIPSESTFLI